jgi:hypothetical protein
VCHVSVNAQTVVITVLTRSVPQLGSGHANHEIISEQRH